MLNNELTRKHTAFSSFDALLNAPGGYFPSLNVAIPEIKTLADNYDFCQAGLDDARRVARYLIRSSARCRDCGAESPKSPCDECRRASEPEPPMSAELGE